MFCCCWSIRCDVVLGCRRVLSSPLLALRQCCSCCCWWWWNLNHAVVAATALSRLCCHPRHSPPLLLACCNCICRQGGERSPNRGKGSSLKIYCHDYVLAAVDAWLLLHWMTPPCYSAHCGGVSLSLYDSLILCRFKYNGIMSCIRYRARCLYFPLALSPLWVTIIT